MKLARIVKTLSLFVLILLIVFLILEQGSRFYLFGFDSFSYAKMNSVHPLGVSGLIKPSSHLEIIYELKPNIDTYFKLVRFKTNSQGLRDKEYAKRKPQNTFRVVVLGDSFAMPAGVDINDAFHTILENRLNKESSDISYEFINYGVGGYDPNQYLATLKYRGLAYDPDLVLFCLSSPIVSFYSEKHYGEVYKVKPKTYPFFESFFIRLTKINKIYIYFEGKHRERINEIKHQGHTESERLKKLKNIFLRLREISKTRSIPICIVILQSNVRHEKKCEEIMVLASKFGLYAVNTTPAFRGTKKSEFYIYKIDKHPNAKANKIFADVIYTYLKDQHIIGRATKQ